MTTKAFSRKDLTKYQKLLDKIKEQRGCPKNVVQASDSVQQSTHISQGRHENKDMSMLDVNLAPNSLENIIRRQTYSQWEEQEQQPSECYDQLKQKNKKLFSDNKVLIAECVRLKKLLSERKEDDISEYSARIKSLQIVNLEYMNQINQLKAQILSLKMKQKDYKLHIAQIQGSNKYIQDDVYTKLSQLSNQNRNISTKLNMAKKMIKFEPCTRSPLGKCDSQPKLLRQDYHQSISRKIKNIKAVYSDQMKTLQHQAAQHKQQQTVEVQIKK